MKKINLLGLVTLILAIGQAHGQTYLYVSDSSSPLGAVYRYTTTGANAPSTGNLGATFVTGGLNSLNSGQGLAIGPNGNLFVGGYYNVGIKQYDGVTGAFVAGGYAGGLNYTPSDTDNTDSGVNWIAYDHLGNPGQGTRGLTFGPDGKLYVAYEGRARLAQYQGPAQANPGLFNGLFGPAAYLDSDGFGGPTDFQFAANGDILAVSIANRRVKRIDSAGNFLGNATEAATLDANLNLFRPFGIAINPATGNIYVSDLGLNGFADGSDDFIARFDSAGNYLGQVGLTGQFAQIRDIDFGPDGLLYIVGQATAQIFTYNPSDSSINALTTTGQGGVLAPTFIDFQVVPEPSALALCGIGLVGACLLIGRNRRRDEARG